MSRPWDRLADLVGERWDALEPDDRRFAWGYALLLPAMLAPLFATDILPALDLPFHMAIADMLAKAGPASPYADLYAPRLWPPPPALPWLWLAALGKLLPLATAARVTVGLYVAALPLSVAALARALGSRTTPALLALPLAYNLGLHYGFLGYVLSLPVLFATLALTVALLRAGSRARWTGLALVASACALYGCHLETFCIGAATSLALIALLRGPGPRRALTLVCFAPALLVAVTWHLGTPFVTRSPPRGLRVMIDTLFAVRRAELEGRSLLSDLALRLEGIPVHLLRGFRDGADRAAGYVLLAIVVVTLAAALVAHRQARSRGRPSSAFAGARGARLVFPAVALLAYLALPHHFDPYEAMSISPRLAPLFVLAVLASVPLAATAPGPRPQGERSFPSMAWAVFGATLAFGFAYGAVLTREYRAFSRELADFRAVISSIPAGVRLVGLVFDGESRVMNVESVARALPSLYVALRPSPASTVVLRYCGMRHIPCSLGPLARAQPPLDPWAPERFDAAASRDRFDWILTRSEPPAFAPLRELTVERTVTRGEWSALRIVH